MFAGLPGKRQAGHRSSSLPLGRLAAQGTPRSRQRIPNFCVDQKSKASRLGLTSRLSRVQERTVVWRESPCRARESRVLLKLVCLGAHFQSKPPMQPPFPMDIKPSRSHKCTMSYSARAALSRCPRLKGVDGTCSSSSLEAGSRRSRQG